MVVIVTNIPTPYRIPLFNSVSALLAAHSQTLHVVFAMRKYSRRRWVDVLDRARFEYTVLDTPRFEAGFEQVFFVPRGIKATLDKLHPECIVVSGFNLMAVAAARYASNRRIPYVVWSGETIDQFRQRSLRYLRTLTRRKLVGNAAAFISYGRRASEYLESLGVGKNRIHVAVNTVDTDVFLRASDSLPKNDGSLRLLYVGHLQERKGLQYVLKAMEKLRDIPVSLDVVGSGPMQPVYQRYTEDHGLTNVVFHGFKQQDDLTQYYPASDIFLFPSTSELFGLVMVEAAASGLPIIASKLAGGTVDIVQDGVNGYVVDPTNVDELTGKIRDLWSYPEKRKAMGAASRQIVRDSVNIHRSAQGFVDGVMAGLADKPG